MVNQDAIRLNLMHLSSKKQLALALLVIERMLPSLVVFSSETGFDDSQYLRAKSAAWTALRNSTQLRELKEASNGSMPDTEEFSHELTSFALNAALAIREIAEFILDGGSDHISAVAALAEDSIYLYLSNLDSSVLTSPEENSRIAQHPLMIEEQKREHEDIRFLFELPDEFDDAAISNLKARASTQTPLLPLPD